MKKSMEPRKEVKSIVIDEEILLSSRDPMMVVPLPSWEDMSPKAWRC
jgi:hypothetical protein